MFLAATMTMAACQTQPGAGTGSSSGKSAALRAMETVAIAAHRCWIASGDPAFSRYSFANELNSFSGRPRFLLVPKGNFGGKPLLVVESSGPAGRVDAFGPLMQGENANRIAADIARWSGGSGDCGATG